MIQVLAFSVAGRPVPKGAVSAFVVPGKSGKRARAVVVQGGSKAKRSNLAEWSAAIQDAAILAFMGRDIGRTELERACFVATPVRVQLTFRLGRPKNHYGTGRNAAELKREAPTHPIGTPDIDKLTRTVLDAMIGVAFDDDSRVTSLTARKVYAKAEGLDVEVEPASVDFIFRHPDAEKNLIGFEGSGRLLDGPGHPTGAMSSEQFAGAYERLRTSKSFDQMEAVLARDPILSAVTKDVVADIADGPSRVRKLIAGSQFEAESHAMKKHGPRSTGRTCVVCGAATPYTDRDRCEAHNGLPAAGLGGIPQDAEGNPIPPVEDDFG